MHLKNIIYVTLLFVLITSAPLFAANAAVPDADITSNVQNKLVADSAMAGTSIKVTTSNGKNRY